MSEKSGEVLRRRLTCSTCSRACSRCSSHVWQRTANGRARPVRTTVAHAAVNPVL
jgi:hypothetical protein